VVIRPILFPCISVNQSAPSGPGVTAKGSLDGVGMTYSLITCAGAIAGSINSPAVNHARDGIRECLHARGNIGLLEIRTIPR